MNPTLVRWLQAPSVILLLVWMIVPLSMTIYFSTIRYNLLYPERTGFIGLDNYRFFATDPSFGPALINTLVLVGSVLVITIVLGLAISILIDRPFRGRGIARVMLISPFFIMPTVSALVWKNMLMDPNNGLFAAFSKSFGLEPVEWLAQYPLFSIILMVSWQWTPFAILIFMTSLQSQDQEQKEAATLDGAGFWSQFWNLTLPHLARPISIVLLIQMIFHLSIFAEIFVTTSGGPGVSSTNLTYLIYIQSQQAFDVGVASAGGVFAIILANIVALFLIRAVGKTLTV
ncbi:sorbitol ABC transporter membrane protein /mannitol ABC transporter membrane protein [Litoreibacter halocynthiae]|uniref:Sorbitol ABC transporter membrane protein /mannitol ABC transporter membrane protein n=2 Tax=Litoreibacter TaxID=947567 RepID=A0A4R7LGP8_9RHOB|nr:MULTISPECIES: sugar ABC transporter permease [Litoreibacter]TDT73812.1 sorbitol ABC transporter membrane protein /mannitol ABC transporter membrane protein [Litoreibacter halocynthiae]SHF34188.1 sorbitol ABC transporter membrane protein /mannitol ABC transporter membrane protein [Litoreibacter ascidiaceicola]